MRKPNLPTINLLKAHGGRWCPGKTHVVINYPYVLCGRPIYGQLVKGTFKDVTCKKCIRASEPGRQ